MTDDQVVMHDAIPSITAWHPPFGLMPANLQTT
jgi:hypothetical protein